MDKLTRIKTLIACAIVALGFSSCSEDQTSLSIDNIQGKAIIKGSFVYDDNKTSSSSTAVNTEKPVMNTTVYVMINNSSFNTTVPVTEDIPLLKQQRMPKVNTKSKFPPLKMELRLLLRPNHLRRRIIKSTLTAVAALPKILLSPKMPYIVHRK